MKPLKQNKISDDEFSPALWSLTDEIWWNLPSGPRFNALRNKVYGLHWDHGFFEILEVVIPGAIMEKKLLRWDE